MERFNLPLGDIPQSTLAQYQEDINAGWTPLGKATLRCTARSACSTKKKNSIFKNVGIHIRVQSRQPAR
jgi:hypothetical protein